MGGPIEGRMDRLIECHNCRMAQGSNAMTVGGVGRCLPREAAADALDLLPGHARLPPARVDRVGAEDEQQPERGRGELERQRRERQDGGRGDERQEGAGADEEVPDVHEERDDGDRADLQPQSLDDPRLEHGHKVPEDTA